MILLDANYVLRFLLRDNEEMYQIVRELISRDVCHIDNEVLVEVVFVLVKVYDVSRHTIRTSLEKTVALANIRVHDEAVILRALEIFDERNLDIVDAICVPNRLFMMSELLTKTSISVFDISRQILKLTNEAASLVTVGPVVLLVPYLLTWHAADKRNAVHGFHIWRDCERTREYWSRDFSPV